jgi:Zn-dependent peptidase ImmA (M78 family)/transcriptional regulator with XRE-family HTH domain
MASAINPLIGLRLSALREQNRLSQSDMAKLLGLKSHQIVSTIEAGVRPMKADEMSALVKHFGITPDYLTDPFRLVGEGQFSWRQSQCSAAVLAAYQERAGTWLAAYRTLSDPLDRPGPRERLSLKLWEKSSFELAMAEGERLTVDYRMGDVPAARLPEVMEQDFGILVLMVDADSGISGAACRLPELDAVLVNRNESSGRRNFDLAHEFFHLLTWDTMPPGPVEEASENGGSRIEQLANVFASALLMPQRLLSRYGEWRRLGNSELGVRMREVADLFRVSVTALRWRLVALNLLNKASARVVVEPLSDTFRRDTPEAFSPLFMKVMSKAIEKGDISVGRLTKLLDVSRDRLRELFAAHAVRSPVTV